MGKHAVWATGALDWVRVNKGKTLALAVAALGLLSRYVPAFPSDAVLDIVRILLGA